MNLDKVKEALIMGLNAVESAGWTRSQEKEAQEIREALAELEKPAEYVSMNDMVYNIALNFCGAHSSDEYTRAENHAKNLITQYAESYHAKKCAECVGILPAFHHNPGALHV